MYWVYEFLFLQKHLNKVCAGTEKAESAGEVG